VDEKLEGLPAGAGSRDLEDEVRIQQGTCWLVIFILMQGICAATPGVAGPLNSWSISCGVDAGSIKRVGKTWTFRTSANHCEGGIFNQRAEISTQSVTPSHKGAYLFTSMIAMRADSDQQFSIFSVHDARIGCGPPFQLYVKPNGELWVSSDVKTGPGESCIRGSLGNGTSNGRFRRDGTAQELKILISFGGNGGFDATVWLGGRPEIKGHYEPQTGAYRSKKFYFKHGVYSQERFGYEMMSKDMSVKTVRTN
jgi:hypothetical protein